MQTKNALSNVYVYIYIYIFFNLFIYYYYFLNHTLCVLLGTETLNMYIVLYFQCVHRDHAIAP